MNPENNLGLLLDVEGNIAEIISDSNNLLAGVSLGMPFARLAASGSLAKALSFIIQIQRTGAAFDWEFSIVVMGEPRSLHFTGGKVGEKILVVAALNGAVALHYYEEMMRINNEQVNSLRQVFGSIQRDTDMYDEISRLNNELVGMQRELAKKNAELTQLNQEKNRFLGIAAHDLRNPLSAILGLSELLMDDAEGEARDLLAEIHTSSRFMTRLIDDLLDVAKIESGQVALEYAPCDVNQLLETIVKRQNLLVARKQVEIAFIGQPLPPAHLDISKIEQVLNNLIGNAIKFSVPGGHIDVRLHQVGGHFEIAVQDWGTGIPPEIQKRLFTEFIKGQTGTAGERSTGLGLVIVKRIVLAHGGNIHLESTPGIGTTFFVSLPFEPAHVGENR